MLKDLSLFHKTAISMPRRVGERCGLIAPGLGSWSWADAWGSLVSCLGEFQAYETSLRSRPCLKINKWAVQVYMMTSAMRLPSYMLVGADGRPSRRHPWRGTQSDGDSGEGRATPPLEGTQQKTPVERGTGTRRQRRRKGYAALER